MNMAPCCSFYTMGFHFSKKPGGCVWPQCYYRAATLNCFSGLREGISELEKGGMPGIGQSVTSALPAIRQPCETLENIVLSSLLLK